jgi:hypothetical protein
MPDVWDGPARGEPVKPQEVQGPIELPDPAQMAESVRRIQDGTQKLLKAGLNRRALLVLLKDSSGISMADIAKVLDSLSSLAATYVDARRKAQP